MNIFDVGITLVLVNKVSAGLAQVTQSLTRTQAASAALQSRLNKIGSTFSSGLVMVGAGAALAAPLIMATNEAAKLEKALKNVQQITRASQEQMAAYGPIMTTASHKTAVFSKAMLADFALHMAQGGVRDSTAIQKLLPMWADAADILKITKGTNPNQVAEALTSISHQFGNFEPNAKMAQLVQDFVTLMQTSPSSVTQFVRGGAYINPLASRIFNIDERSLLAMQATMAQTGGGGGRGGLSPAQQANLITRSLPGIFGSGLLSGKSAFGLSVMGLTDKSGLSTLKTGDKFDLMKLSDKLAGFEALGQTAVGRMEIAHRMMRDAPMMGKKQGEMEAFARTVLAKHGDVMPSEMIMKSMQFAFGAGRVAAALIGDPAFKKQLEFNINRMKTAKSLDTQQRGLSGTLSFAKIQAATDLGSLMADIGMRILPTATKIVKAIDSIIFKMDEFVLKHPKITTAILAVIGALSGLLIVGGLINIFAAAGMGLMLVLAPVGAAIGAVIPVIAAVVAAIAPFLIPAALLIGAIVAIVLIVKNWGAIMKFIAPAIDAVCNALRGMVHALAFVVGQIGRLIALIPGLSGLGLALMQGANGMARLTAASNAQQTAAKPSGSNVVLIGTARSANSKPYVVHNDNSINNFTVQQVPGHDHEACARTIKKTIGSALHKADASGGNSVGRSINQKGNHR